MKKVEGQFVDFAFKGRHQELLEGIRVSDVAVDLPAAAASHGRATDAMRSAPAGSPRRRPSRFVRRIREKVKEGLALEARRKAS